MINEIADYILDLSKGLEETKYAEDRNIYKMYLSEAAVMLAKAVKGIEKKEMTKLIHDHERLWDHAWLQDESYQYASKSFTLLKTKFE